jgi:hypothetical protein
LPKSSSSFPMFSFRVVSFLVFFSFSILQL